MFCQTILVVIRNNKATQHKKETYSNKTFFKKMNIKKIFLFRNYSTTFKSITGSKVVFFNLCEYFSRAKRVPLYPHLLISYIYD